MMRSLNSRSTFSISPSFSLSAEINPLFRNFERHGKVTGYGISHPGHLYEQMLAWQNGTMTESERKLCFDPMTLGFYTTLVLQGAEQSLGEGKKMPGGATLGSEVRLTDLLSDELGLEAAAKYLPEPHSCESTEI